MMQFKSPAIVSEKVLPRGLWEWMLAAFVVGSLTLGEIAGFSKIMILYGLLFFFFFIIYVLYNKISVNLIPEVVLYYVWIIWALAGLVNANDTTLYFSKFRTVIQIGIMIVLVAAVTAMKRNMSMVMFGLLSGVVVVSLFSIWSGEFLQVSGADSRTRAEGLVGNPNDFAYLFLMMTFALVFFWKNRSSAWWKLLIAAGVLFAIAFIIVSGSRKTILGVLLFLFFSVVLCKSRRIDKNAVKRYIFLIVLLLIVYGSASLVISNTLLSKRFESEEIERGENVRMQMYAEGMEMIRNHFFLGMGLNNYKTESSFGLYSHSDYVEVAASTGFVGFVMYFSMYVVLWMRISRIRKMTQDPHIFFNMGLLKAAILTILLLAFGKVNIAVKINWVFLAAAFGYSWSVEKWLLSRCARMLPAMGIEHSEV